MNTRCITDYVKRSENGVELNLVFENQSFEWKLYENNMVRPETTVRTMRNGKYEDIPFDHSCRTYIGYRDDMEKDARFTISTNNFAAKIPSGDSYVLIQSLSDFVQTDDPSLFILYRPEDLIRSDHSKCNVISAPKPDIAHEEPVEKKDHHDTGNRTYSCRELEVTLATDWLMFGQYSNEDDIIDFNLTVMNFMEPYFDDFDLDFWVRQFFIVTEFDSDANPWGDALEVDDLLADFGDWAYGNFSTEDIGHLWTTGNLHDSGDQGTIGYASVGGACDDIGLYPWALLENFDENDFYRLSILQAHEYGHLLDADHEEGSGTIMENNLGNVDCTCWDPDNIEEMIDFMEDETCIESCNQCPTTYNIIDYIGWGDWRYSAQQHINSKAIINGSADVVCQANDYVKLNPGFKASSRDPSSSGSTFIAKIAGCE